MHGKGLTMVGETQETVKVHIYCSGVYVRHCALVKPLACNLFGHCEYMNCRIKFTEVTICMYVYI